MRHHAANRRLFALPAAAVLAILSITAPPAAAASAADASPDPAPAEQATAPDPLPMARLAGPIVVDGALDEEAWKGAAVVERFYEIAPGDRGEPPVRTVGLLGYDSAFLYVGARCYDPEPAKIRAPLVERDRVFNQDLVQIDLDARDEGRWSMIFRVNPRGVQADAVWDEAAGYDDFSPDFHWESATRLDERGWTAEMRIPLSTLRYRAGDPQTWRISFFRLYPRQFRYQIASGPIPRSSNCWLCHSGRFTGVTGLPGGGGFTTTPYVSGGATREGAEDGGEAGRVDAGIDLKWLPRPNLAVDLTLNPDFSQVESDVAQIGINERFALFYPEKRPFFLEGSDLWNSPIAAVHTRTITEPDWGVRLTGRPGDGSYTLLAAGDRGGGSTILPSPTGSSLGLQPEDTLALLGRWRHSFGRSSLGALGTLRDAPGGYFNGVGGVDFQWYPTTADRATGQLLWSTTDEGGASAAGHALHLAWQRTQQHLGWAVLLEDLDRDFRADSGFVPQVGVRHLQGSMGYSLYPEAGRVRSVRPALSFDEVRERGGGLVAQSASVGLTLDGSMQASIAWHPADRERADDGRLFDLGYFTASARILPGRRVPVVFLSARHGDELDLAGSRVGTGAALAVQANVSATDRLQAELSAEQRRLDVREAARELRLFTATVARARLVYTFTPRAFARLIGEWQGVASDAAGVADTDDLGGSLLYGYRLNWQSILYLGYGNTPAAAGGDERRQELFLKVGYAIRP